MKPEEIPQALGALREDHSCCERVHARFRHSECLTLLEAQQVLLHEAREILSDERFEHWDFEDSDSHAGFDDWLISANKLREKLTAAIGDDAALEEEHHG